MKLLMLTLLALVTTGCAGTVLDGRFCTLATDEDAKKDIKVIVENVAEDLDKKHVELALKAASLGSTALCEAARAKGRPVIIEQNQVKE